MGNTMLKASVLVVSRTADLLNSLLQSLDQAYSGVADAIEVITSWNGSAEDEHRIQAGRLPFRIAQRDPYHFAGNMNRLAREAKGQILVFANDDLIADPGSIDIAIDRLKQRPEVGIVGARLRTSNGQLAHAGIHFTSHGSPYHQLMDFADAEHPANGRERLVPAVTGAFMAMRRNDFLAIEMRETFQACGEDVLLNLETRLTLHKHILFCPDMSGIHDAESTRRHFVQQQANDGDLQQMRFSWLETMELANPDILRVELSAAQDEAEDLRSHCLQLTHNQKQLIHQVAHLAAQETKQCLERSILESDNKRLKAQVLQLSNQLAKPMGSLSHQSTCVAGAGWNMNIE